MKRIETLVKELTNPPMILQEVKEILRRIDPAYPEEEKGFSQAVDNLCREVGETRAGEYLAALEQELASDVIFAGWNGFLLNLECFKNPTNKLLLKEDFACILQEQQMEMLPMARNANATINAFLATLQQDQHGLTDEIQDYYAYLQTYAYKLAHYFGFNLADYLLPYMVPGYVRDETVTIRYAAHICQSLDLVQIPF